MSTEINLLSENKSMDDEEEQTEWILEDFEVGVCLGNGKFGYVYKAVEKKSQKEIAIKVISKKIIAQYEFFDQLKCEIEIHTRLMHKNIVRMYGYFYDDSYVYLVYEYINKGNLFHLIKSLSKISEKEASKYIFQISQALLCLKKRNIIHRDLKLENVMIEESTDGKDEEKFTIKLADFGWSCQYFTEKRKTLCGTPEYLPPEMIEGLPHDYKVDIWSLGIMTYEMVTGYSPFYGDESELLQKIKNFQGFLEIKERLDGICASEELCDFISRLIVSDSSLRLPVEDVLKHPWIILYN